MIDNMFFPAGWVDLAIVAWIVILVLVAWRHERAEHRANYFSSKRDWL